MDKEIELKLIGDEKTITTLMQQKFAGVVSQSDWITSRLISTYYDNKGFQLNQLKIGLRIRRGGEHPYIQTVKTAGKVVGGLYQRNESEANLEKEELDLSLVEDPYLAILLEEAVEDGGEFKPIFSTSFKRRSCMLEFEDKSVIEMCIDQGFICVDGNEAPISEIEIELKQGKAKYLFQLAQELLRQNQLQQGLASKSQRGYSLCSHFKPESQSLSVIELTKGIEAEEAFERICYAGVSHWNYYQYYLESSISEEAILQMYNAMRYMQHVYSVFGAVIPRKATSELRTGWSWLSQALEPAVELAQKKQFLDRFLESTEQKSVLVKSQRRLERDFKHHVKKFNSLMASQRYTLLMLKLSEWLYFKDWREHLKERTKDKFKEAIVGFARKQLSHTLKELKRIMDSKQEMLVDEYFELTPRLSKALNIGLFFGSLFDNQKRELYRQPWLDILSGINELKQNHFIAQLQIKENLEQENEIGEWLEQRNQKALDVMEQSRAQVLKMKPYWL